MTRTISLICMLNIFQISRRAQLTPATPIRKLVPFADQTKARGIKVYHLNIGDPDFEIAALVRQALQKTAGSLRTLSYANSRGAEEHLQAWLEYYRNLGLKISGEDMVVTHGGSEALVLAMAAILDPGDEILFFEPFYANYLGFASLLSIRPKPVTLVERNGFHLLEQRKIESKITPKTKAILFANPNNPTGTVFHKDEIRMIIDIAAKHNLFLIGDEVYHGLCFDNKKSYSLLHLADKKEKQHIVICDSVSKRLSACGARIGVAISENKELMAAILRFAQARVSVATLEQKIIAPALARCFPYVATLAKKYQRRRDVFLPILEKELGIEIHYPEGAFYTMVKLPIQDSDDFAKWLLTDFSDKGETVMVAPGAGFYITPGLGKDEIRVAYVLNKKDLKRAAQLLVMGVQKYLKVKLSNKEI